MKSKLSGYHDFFVNRVFPAIGFGAVTGAATGAVVTVYKYCVKHTVALSAAGYAYLRGHIYWLPVVLAALLGIAYVFAFIYRKHPNLRGGGIPTSIGFIRGQIPFHWLINLIGLFGLSMVGFLIGVPLGTEGPSTQIGTAIGRGSVYTLAKKHKAWDRYSMSGGASAGFATATGAPVTGVVFAIEEAHHSTSPMIMIVAAVSVACAHAAAGLLSPLLGVSARLFEWMELPTLAFGDWWMPALIGAGIGLFSALFLRYYRWISRLFNHTLARIPAAIKMFAVFAVTVGLGLCSHHFISTGHELVESLFEFTPAVWMLLLILVIRSTGTLSATSNGITGGLYLPTLALGAVLASLIGTLCLRLGVSPTYLGVILSLGMAACIAGMMKTPITAIVFAVEALSCSNNIVPVIVAVIISFIITEIFNAKSVSECVLEHRIEEMRHGKTPQTSILNVTVQPRAFAVGKQVRDILWPNGLYVLSMQRPDGGAPQTDVHGEKVIGEGDVLQVRCVTYDETAMWAELVAIVGEQKP